MALAYTSHCGDWNPLADKFYRKHELYRMMWSKVDLAKMTVVAAPFGGPIAMMRNDRKMMAVPALNTKPTMYIYTSSGNLLTQFQWDKSRMVAMGWTLKEILVCVMEYGTLRLYDLQGDFVQITLGEEAKENGILDAHVWDNSVVVLTTNLRLILVANLNEPRPVLLANPGLVQPPHSWTFISASQSLSKHVEILLSVNNTVIVVDAKNAQDQMLQQGPFTRMAVSPNAKISWLYLPEMVGCGWSLLIFRLTLQSFAPTLVFLRRK
ncbi:hypothetical protein BASA81_013392 [Batrachochytrium salamandrivorans]|nr:hypothetical protein BASA81_013392 [Batrachochytrium salamandrivorans]